MALKILNDIGLAYLATKIKALIAEHTGNKSNPHGVTKAQVGLGNVDNTSDANKPVSTATQTALNGKADADLSNVDDTVFADKANTAGVGGTPIVSAASTDGVVYTATVPGVTALTAGLTITIIPEIVSTSTTTKLNINGLGEKNLRQPLTTNTTTSTTAESESWLSAGKPVTVMYDGTLWKTTSLPKASLTNSYGQLPVSKGGTGVNNLTAGSYLVGNDAEDVQLKTPAEVLADIGAASSEAVQTAQSTADTALAKANANSEAIGSYWSDVTSSFTATLTDGDSTVDSFNVFKKGNRYHVYIVFRTSASTSAGVTLGKVTITGALPPYDLNCVCFSAKCIGAAIFTNSGTITAKNMYSTASASYTFAFNFEYEV